VGFMITFYCRSFVLFPDYLEDDMGDQNDKKMGLLFILNNAKYVAL
jgi:hypothetical protein